MNDVLAIRRDSENVISVTIPAETNTSDVINILKDNGLIKHKHFCKVFAKIMNYRDDNYMSGIYYITKSMGVEKMLSTFKSSVNGRDRKAFVPRGLHGRPNSRKARKI